MAIEDVISAYLDNRRSSDVADSTMVKYQTFTNQLRRFAAHKGYVMIDQFTAGDMDQFYATWKDSANSKGKKLERMKGFWKFCVKRKWISDEPSDVLEPPVNYSIPKHKSPFTDDELDRIYKAAAAWRPMPWHNRGERGVITADQVIAFAMLLTETGLRISDAATFNIDRLNKETQECFLFMHKTGKPLFTWVNDDLFARLMDLSKQLGPTPFVTQSTDKQTAADAWRERLSKVFTEARPFAEHPTPHRFRHTFVRVQLARGVPGEDVAELIGDTPEMVRRHYARWVPERQKRLTNILREAYQESQKAKWRAHVVKMPTVINP
jgi:site-specific recombinase XerD